MLNISNILSLGSFSNLPPEAKSEYPRITMIKALVLGYHPMKTFLIFNKVSYSSKEPAISYLSLIYIKSIRLSNKHLWSFIWSSPLAYFLWTEEINMKWTFPKSVQKDYSFDVQHCLHEALTIQLPIRRTGFFQNRKWCTGCCHRLVTYLKGRIGDLQKVFLRT